jgi:hypothetical protein
MKRLFILGALALVVGCGPTAEHEPAASEVPETLGQQEAELLYCGLGCASGTHPTYYTCSGGCLGNCPNQTNCEVNSGTFYTCNIGCPSGWHPIAYDLAGGCYAYANQTGKNRTLCQPNTGTAFYTCGIGCPSGYRAVSYSTVGECYIYSNQTGQNRTYCTKI